MASEGLAAAARRCWMLAWAGSVMLAYPAAGQGIVMPPNLNNFQGFSGAPNIGGQAPPTARAAPARPPPAGLPGAQPKAAPAPPTQPPSTMNPTDALFDAINRGDLAAAQDAVGRGADLNGHDVLGMTPVQLSIDLGRNDITFLLLSTGGGGAASSQPAPGPGNTTAKRASGGKVARTVARRLAAQPRVAPAPAPPQMPRLFAGNGGTPIPSAGFLGFDPGR